MCRQKELAERASKVLRACKVLGNPVPKGFTTIVEAIQSNEPNNLAKAARVLTVYEDNLRQQLLQKQAQQQQQDKTPPPKPVKLVTTPHKPTPPPMGLTPTAKPMPQTQPLEIKGTDKTTTTTNQPQARRIQHSPRRAF